MKLTTVTVQRNKVPAPLATGVAVQIDQISLDMMQFDKGAAPFDLFMVYVPYDPAGIQRNDHLIDESSQTRYTVSARPETFIDGHVELTAFVSVGS